MTLDDTKQGDHTFKSILKSAVQWAMKNPSNAKERLLAGIIECSSKDNVSDSNVNENNQFITHIINEINNYALNSDGKIKIELLAKNNADCNLFIH